MKNYVREPRRWMVEGITFEKKFATGVARMATVYDDGERVILKAINGTVAFNGTKALLQKCIERGWISEEISR